MTEDRDIEDTPSATRATPLDDQGKLWVISSPFDNVALDGLTEAEREVVSLMMLGHSNAEIAARRGVAVRTVANQLRAVYTKLSINSRSELVAVLMGGARPVAGWDP